MYNSLRPIYKLYILFFPLQLFPFLNGFKNMFSSAAAINNDFFILAIGMVAILWVTGGKLYYSKQALICDSTRLIAALLILSLVTSIILYIPFGTLYGENTLSATFAQNIYLILTGVAFYFNYTMFQTITKQEIEKLIDFMCLCMIFLGVLDIAIIAGIPGIGSIYDKLDIFNILPDADYMLKMGRICLTASEPSGMGNIIGVLLIPYTLGQLIYRDYKKGKYILFTIVFVLLSFFSFSTTVYVCIIVNFVVFTLLKIKKDGIVMGFVLFLVVIPVMVILWNIYVKDTYFGHQIIYLLADKTTSTSNMSTTYRYSTVLNDLNCFIHYPLSGVGNGNQGFLYNESMNLSVFTDEMRTNYQIVNAMNGSMGVVSGGAFVPAFISGYGIIGIVALVCFLRRCVFKIKDRTETMGCFKNLFYIGGITFLVSSTVSGGLDGNFLVIFVCSLPLMADCGNAMDEVAHA